ncbi:MAG: prephenate dehydratase [Candidatus Berkelbacteria bacterium]|nr:prephenate dehydratase [Candidatus Berkelbacteria bacterium]
MKKEIIGVSGGKASFSEEAAEYYCAKNKIKKYEIKHLISVENVLTELDEGKIDLGVFPIENSNGGIVYEAVYAMSKHLFEIEKLFEVDIKHNLIALPSLSSEQVTVIASHDQALRQCKMYLGRVWPGIEIKEWVDTADAVRAIKNGELPKTAAAIAPRKAAELYKMKILEEGIQDLKFNFTTFLTVRKK